MDIKKYIASGILENYALGLVSENERQEVERMLVAYPELRTELQAIEEALEGFAQANALPLPEGLEEAALGKIDSLLKNSPQKSSKAPEAVPGGKSLRSPLIILGVSTALLAALCIYCYFQHQETVRELNQVQRQLRNLQTDFDAQTGRINELEIQNAILRDTSNQFTLMKGTANAPDGAVAAVHLNPLKNTIYLDVLNLRPAPLDKQYELWAIVDGAPVNIGVFEVQTEADSSFIEIPFIENAAAFAVTLENKGAAKATPDLSQLYVIGEV